MTKKQKKVLIRIIAATILLVLFKVIDVEDRFENIIPNIPGRYIGLVFYIVPYYPWDPLFYFTIRSSRLRLGT